MGVPLLGVLAPDAEALDERAVPLDVGGLQVLEQAATLTDQQQQAAPAVVVVLVGLQVLSEVGDALAQKRDLDLGAAGVALFGSVLGDDGLLDFSVERHGCLRIPLGRVDHQRPSAWLVQVAVRGAPAPWPSREGYQRGHVGAFGSTGAATRQSAPARPLGSIR